MPAPIGPVDSPASPHDLAPTPPRTRRLHAMGQDLFEVNVGAEWAMRRFEYVDGFTQNLRDYRLDVAPIVAAAGEFYPLAGSHPNIASDMGIVFGYARAIALPPSSSEAGPVTTMVALLRHGGRFRGRVGSEMGPLLGLGVHFWRRGVSPTGRFLGRRPTVRRLSLPSSPR